MKQIHAKHNIDLNFAYAIIQIRPLMKKMSAKPRRKEIIAKKA